MSYDSNAGFRVSVDMALNCGSKKYPTFAMLSMVSRSDNNDSDTKFNLKLDYNSFIKSPKWTDGFHVCF